MLRCEVEEWPFLISPGTGWRTMVALLCSSAPLSLLLNPFSLSLSLSLVDF